VIGAREAAAVGVGDATGGCCDVWQEVGRLPIPDCLGWGESREDDREERTRKGLGQRKLEGKALDVYITKIALFILSMVHPPFLLQLTA